MLYHKKINKKKKLLKTKRQCAIELFECIKAGSSDWFTRQNGLKCQIRAQSPVNRTHMNAFAYCKTARVFRCTFKADD